MFDWLKHCEALGDTTSPDEEQSYSCASCSTLVWVGPSHGNRSADLRDQIEARKCSACFRKWIAARAADVVISITLAFGGPILIAAFCLRG